jgi:hypothetical protein
VIVYQLLYRKVSFSLRAVRSVELKQHVKRKQLVTAHGWRALRKALRSWADGRGEEEVVAGDIPDTIQQPTNAH